MIFKRCHTEQSEILLLKDLLAVSLYESAPCDFLPLPYPFTYALTLEWDIVAAVAAAGAAGSHLLTTFSRIFPLPNSIIIIIIASESIAECSSSIKTQSEGR